MPTDSPIEPGPSTGRLREFFDNVVELPRVPAVKTFEASNATRCGHWAQPSDDHCPACGDLLYGYTLDGRRVRIVGVEY